MPNGSLDSTIQPTTNRRRTFVATVVVLTLLLAGFYLLYTHKAEAPVAPPQELTQSATSSLAMEEAEPLRLKIPSINLEAPFSDPLGLEASGEIEVPDDYVSVGYYKFGPTPGEMGPAVVLGHVDSKSGPAVFYSLGKLKEGDEVMIERKDGSVATFAVTALERNSQSSFPTDKVYSNLDHAGLRLITCSGQYDQQKLRYSHNLIVYGKLVATSTASGV